MNWVMKMLRKKVINECFSSFFSFVLFLLPLLLLLILLFLLLFLYPPYIFIIRYIFYFIFHPNWCIINSKHLECLRKIVRIANNNGDNFFAESSGILYIFSNRLIILSKNCISLNWRHAQWHGFSFKII